jgi:undecaprenyl diphosphate synthase
VIIIENLPKSIGIIMDGNGRWAKKRGLPTIMGHREGANALKKIVEYSNKIGIEYLTVYAFSTENWKRTKEEVNGLMTLLNEYLDSFEKNFNKQNIRIKVIGRRNLLSKGLQEKIINVEKKTSDKDGLTFVIALDYGGRQELVSAIQKIAKQVKEENISIDEITEDTVSENLYTRDIKDPDIIIRTSG